MGCTAGAWDDGEDSAKGMSKVFPPHPPPRTLSSSGGTQHGCYQHGAQPGEVLRCECRPHSGQQRGQGGDLWAFRAELRTYGGRDKSDYGMWHDPAVL